MTAPSLGTTFACQDDCDGLFSVCTTDRQILLQEMYHRITTDQVVGDTPEAENWGYDVRRRLGSPMTAGDIAALGPTLGDAVMRSPLFDFADVTATRTSADGAPLALKIAATGRGATGTPFSFVFTLDGVNYLQVGASD